MPDYELILATDRDVHAFVSKHFPTLRTFFQSLNSGIQVSDLYRLLAMHIHGGFYLDTDVMLDQRLDPLCAYDVVFTREWRGPRTQALQRIGEARPSADDHVQLGNYFFGSEPGRPEWLGVFRMAAMRLGEVCPFDPTPSEVLWSTGPDCLNAWLRTEGRHLAGKVVELDVQGVAYYRKNRRRFRLPSEAYRVGRYGVHLMHGGWRRV